MKDFTKTKSQNFVAEIILTACIMVILFYAFCWIILI